MSQLTHPRSGRRTTERKDHGHVARVPFPTVGGSALAGVPVCASMRRHLTQPEPVGEDC
jgi:hypothetical protein